MSTFTTLNILVVSLMHFTERKKQLTFGSLKKERIQHFDILTRMIYLPIKMSLDVLIHVYIYWIPGG